MFPGIPVRALLLVLSFGGAVPGFCQSTQPQKRLEPAFATVEDVDGLPRVLLLGDSISIGYTLPVREALKGKANVHRPPTNCSSTGNALDHLDSWLGRGKWDVIHFNFGLHDAKLPPEGVRHSPPAIYGENLRELVKRLQMIAEFPFGPVSASRAHGKCLSPSKRQEWGECDCARGGQRDGQATCEREEKKKRRAGVPDDASLLEK